MELFTDSGFSMILYQIYFAGPLYDDSPPALQKTSSIEFCVICKINTLVYRSWNSLFSYLTGNELHL